MKNLAVALLTILLLTGCSNETYDKAMEQGKLAVAKQEYNKALGLFELALEEKPDNKEAKRAYNHLVALSGIDEDIKNRKWDDALSKANKLLKEKNIAAAVKKDLKEYIRIAEDGKKQVQAVMEKVEHIKTFISEKNYEEAQTLINELKQDESVKDGFTSFTEEVGKLEVTVNEEIKKQKEAEEAEAKEKARLEAERKKNELKWSTYHNERFGFTIQYPTGWILGPEPTNGDGRSLYNENDAEIVTYGNNYMEETKSDLSDHEKLKTTFGQDAYLKVTKEGAVVNFNGVITDGTIIFNLDGTMSQEFYQKNTNILKQMLLTVKIN
jgi:hypothetical protein